MSYLVWNGMDNINLWSDPWLNNVTLSDQLTGPHPPNELSKTISNIIVNTNNSINWNLDSIPFPIPQNIYDQIQSIALPNPQLQMKDSIF